MYDLIGVGFGPSNLALAIAVGEHNSTAQAPVSALFFERQKRFTPYTAICNVSGQPAVSVPLHWTAAGLPIGVMLAGRMGAEGTLISLSAQLEEARPWHDRYPPGW